METAATQIRGERVSFPGFEGASIDATLFVAPASERGDGSGEESEAGRGVLLIHEVFGADRHMRALGARLAGAGFTCLLPDLYTRTGVPGPEGTDADPAPAWELETIRSAVGGLSDRQALGDLEGGLRFLADNEHAREDAIAAVGFCMGGTLAFLCACTSTRVAAAVDFYGRPFYDELSAEKPTQPIELSLNLDRRLLAFFGEEDTRIPLDQVEKLRDALTAGAKDFEIVTYPEAGHGFMNDLRSSYHEPSARDAWHRTLAFLDEVL